MRQLRGLLLPLLCSRARRLFRQVRSAALDVFEDEPPSASRTAMALVNHPHVISTPHLGASTDEAQTNVVSANTCDVALTLEAASKATHIRPHPSLCTLCTGPRHCQVRRGRARGQGPHGRHQRSRPSSHVAPGAAPLREPRHPPGRTVCPDGQRQGEDIGAEGPSLSKLVCERLTLP